VFSKRNVYSVNKTSLMLEVNELSFESAKKQGFMASMLNIIIPIATLAMLSIFYYQLFYQLFNNQSAPVFWTGAITGFSIATSVLGIIGLILFFVSMHKLSNYFKEPKIFKNILYGFLISIIGSIIIGVITAVFFIMQASSFVSTTPNSSDAVSFALSIIGGIIAIIGVAIIIGIINGVLYWQAFTKLGEKSGVDAFKTAGTLYLIGSILIIVGIGPILQWIAWIFAAEGYRKLQPQPTTNNTTVTTAIASSSAISGKIYCSYCGIENDTNNNSNYCKQCGKPLHTNQTNI
jgi:uncharacterized membrane protein